MKEWLKKYWWAVLIILALPIVINFLLLVPAFSPIVGENTDWLSFWGGYLGALVSAGVAFVILYIQRNDNEAQNDSNRVENEKQNKANRDLQLNIMQYQQQSLWMSQFREASLEYCYAFNYNDIIMVSNIIWSNPRGAFDMIKSLFDRIATTNAKFSFVRKHDDKANELACYIDSIYKEYKMTLNNLQWIALYYISVEDHQRRNYRNLCDFLKNQNQTYKNTSRLLEILPQPVRDVDNLNYFKELVLTIASTTYKFEVNVRDKLYEYIKQEQERIDNILTKDLN